MQPDLVSDETSVNVSVAFLELQRWTAGQVDGGLGLAVDDVGCGAANGSPANLYLYRI